MCTINRVGFVEPLENRTLLAAGDPDSTFNNGSPATISFPGAAFQINDVAIQSDGKVVAVGAKGGSMAVTRLNVNGSIDTTFASGGLFESSVRPAVYGVAIQADGKIILTLAAPVFSLQQSLVRLTANGSIDSSFGSFGQADVDLWFVSDVVIQQDGKIIVVGVDADDEDFGIARLDSTGALDSSFDGDGYKSVGFGNEREEPTAVAVDYNGTPATNPFYGTIVVAGINSYTTTSTRWLMCRLLSNGSLDNRFDGDGKLTSPDLSPQPEESATGVQVQSGGRIVVSGIATAVGGGNETSDFLVVRYLSNGQIDSSFGPFGTGIVQTDFGFDDKAVDSAPGFLGGFLVSGQSNSAGAVAAYTRDGLLDTRFSGDGYLRITSFFGGVRVATSGKTIAPIRRLVIGSGNRVGRYFDVGSVISISTFDAEAAEAGQDRASILVGRTPNLGSVERVYLGVAGTARPPYRLNADYTVEDMTFENPINGPSYIDIRAEFDVVGADIIPVDDLAAEGDETVEITIAPHDAYDVGTPSSTTLIIRDNDDSGGPTVAESKFLYETAPQRVTFHFSQNVGISISAADFQVSGPPGTPPFGFAYDAISNTATLSFTDVLPDGDFTARAIAAGITNAAGQAMPADHVLNFFFLGADANRDRRVNLQDFNILAANFGQPNRTFSQGDFNYSGHVNLADFNTLASRFGAALAASGRPFGGGTIGLDEQDEADLLKQLLS